MRREDYLIIANSEADSTVHFMEQESGKNMPAQMRTLLRSVFVHGFMFRHEMDENVFSNPVNVGDIRDMRYQRFVTTDEAKANGAPF